MQYPETIRTAKLSYACLVITDLVSLSYKPVKYPEPMTSAVSERSYLGLQPTKLKRIEGKLLKDPSKLTRINLKTARVFASETGKMFFLHTIVFESFLQTK